MRKIHVDQITKTVRDLAIEANIRLRPDVLSVLERAFNDEESRLGKEALAQLIENARTAENNGLPICQDTGIVVIFIDLGQEVSIVGGELDTALQEGVRQGYREGYFRASICSPLSRKNTGDNTPAVVYIDLMPGEKMKIALLAKGCGSENMSRVIMLTPSVGIHGIKKEVVETIRRAGPNPCPPTIIGVGIGGTQDKAAVMAKKALLRPLGSTNPDPELAALEEGILQDINRSHTSGTLSYRRPPCRHQCPMSCTPV
jgi:fumarate hydratase subunit alpha